MQVAIDEMHVISGMVDHLMSSSLNSINTHMDVGESSQSGKNLVWTRLCDRLKNCRVDQNGVSFRSFVAEQPMRTAALLEEYQGKPTLKAYEMEDINTVLMTSCMSIVLCWYYSRMHMITYLISIVLFWYYICKLHMTYGVLLIVLVSKFKSYWGSILIFNVHTHAGVSLHAFGIVECQ